MDFTNFQTKLQAASDAMEGGDYATARKQLAVARIAFLGLPESTTSGERGTTFRKAMDDAEKAINSYEQSASGGGGTLLMPVAFGRYS